MGKIIPIERSRENETTKRAKEKDTRRLPRDEARRWRRSTIHHGRENVPFFQSKPPAYHPKYGRYQPLRLLNPLRLSLDPHFEKIYWNVSQDHDLTRSQELALCLQRSKTACYFIPPQIRGSKPSPVGLFSFLSSLLKFSGAARSDSRLSNRLAELMDKNSKQHRSLFANSLEKIKALLWSYSEHSKHAERTAEKELTETIIAERKARQSREERAERKRLEKKNKEKIEQKRQLRRLRAKILNTLVSQMKKIEAIVSKTKSDLFKILLRDIEDAIKILSGNTDDAILRIISAQKKAPINARTVISAAKLIEEIKPAIVSAVSRGNAEMLANLIMELATYSANSPHDLRSLVILQLIKELEPCVAMPLLLSVYSAAVEARNAESATISSARAFIAEAIKQITVDDDNTIAPIQLVDQDYYAAIQEKITIDPAKINFAELQHPGETEKHPDASNQSAEEMPLTENRSVAKKSLKALDKAAESSNRKISLDRLTLGYFYAGILFDKNFLNKQSNISVEISRGQEHYTSVRSLIRIIEVLEGQNQTAIERGQQPPAAISIAAETLLYGLIMRKTKARRSRALKIIAALKNKEETWNELLTAVENRDFKKVKRVLERAVENIWHPYYFRRIAA